LKEPVPFVADAAPPSPEAPLAPARDQPSLVELIPEVLPAPPKLPALSPSVALVLRPLQLEPVRRKESDAPILEPIAPPSEPPPVQHSSPAVALQAEAVPAVSLPAPAVPLPVPSPALPRVKRHRFRLVVRLATTLLITISVLIAALLVLYRWIDPPTSTLMLGQRLAGTPISQHWVPLERVSPNLLAAVIASEDGHFCRHHGVDWGELREAIESTGDGIARGGSTISMQVVKNLFLWPSRSYLRKALEIPLAYAIETLWTKRRIIEIYLNIAEWGPGVFGAEAAARFHFRKSALLLTPREATLLAVSLPNPFERQAGRPGPGTVRLAENLLLRMKAAQASTACVRTRASARPDGG
jgi:monofunctional biosynthetic peptidoglycan transglycosylase